MVIDSQPNARIRTNCREAKAIRQTLSGAADSKRESSAKFEGPVQPYTAENAQFGPLLVVECRGLEFIDFEPRGLWKCKGMKGTVFPDVDLEGGDWTDYDEKAALPVGVSEFGCRWTRA
ncbi:hypothetical protein MSAN_02168600 [Mycena sanguinolenta]|uniref:Uncharacterized protein n=1 Tax=Mycena sanguinolenta TaxID=230812 RepID=A0A8H6XFG9_9AGAR|nr:hypothetical protein MSAN_02168600 [Mycena sanguinolenta]